MQRTETFASFGGADLELCPLILVWGGGGGGGGGGNTSVVNFFISFQNRLTELRELIVAVQL